MRRGLAGLLTATGVSTMGTRMSMLAVPWFTLAATGSPAKTGLVAFAEMLPYVLACAGGGPALDRAGVRRASIAADAASVVAVAAIPLLHAAGMLHFGVLVGLVGAAGLLRGLGDTAKRVVFPAVVAASGVALTRAAGIQDGISRLAGLLGAPLAGVLIAVLSAPNVLLLDAATFAFAALAIGVAVPRPAAEPGPPPPSGESYLRSLRGGLDYVAREPLIRAIMLMLLATNLFDAAYGSVLAPVWARDVAGSAGPLGLLFAAFGLGAVLGNVVFTAIAPRIPRFATYAVGFLVVGAPRYFVLALVDDLWIVYAVAFMAGVCASVLNPILGAVEYERVPEALRSRVLGLVTAVAWAGIPLGGLLGGWAVQLSGLRTAWLAFGAVYLLVTLVPFVQPAWRDLDRPAVAGPGGPRPVAAGPSGLRPVQEPAHDRGHPVGVARRQRSETPPDPPR